MDFVELGDIGRVFNAVLAAYTTVSPFVEMVGFLPFLVLLKVSQKYKVCLQYFSVLFEC